MRLLVDMHCFDLKTSEGINTYLRGIYAEFVEIASDVEFFFVARDIQKLKEIFGEHPNVTYVALTSENRFYRLLFEFPAIIKRHKIDYAHFQYTTPLIKNCKTIVTLHDILFLDYPQYFPLLYRLVKGALFRLSAKRADLLLTVSEYSKVQIAKHFGISEQKIHITNNAVSDQFAKTDLAEAEAFVRSEGVSKYLLYVSRFEPRKNHLRVLKSYVQLRLWERGVSLVFIGKQTIEIPDFDRYLGSLPEDVRGHIRIYNQTSYSELLMWYRAATLFVYPSLAEGFGIPPLEAAVAGVPTICSNRTAMSEFRFFGEGHIDTEDENLLNGLIIKSLSNSGRCDISQEVLATYNWHLSATILRGLLS
ncbi:MAG: glycosyltransferase family 1 protein [Rikenellaceae bacterium]